MITAFRLFLIVVFLFSFLHLSGKGFPPPEQGLDTVSTVTRITTFIERAKTEGKQDDSLASYFFDQAILEAESTGDDSTIAEARYQKFGHFFNRGNYDDARDILVPLEKTDLQSLPYSLYIKIIYGLGWSYGHLGDFTSAQSYFFEGIDRSLETDDWAQYHNMQTGLARIYLVQNFHDEVIDIHKHMLDSMADKFTTMQYGQTYTSLGNAYFKIGEQDLAAIYWWKCVRLLENDTTTSKPFRNISIANCYDNLSWYLEEKGKADSAYLITLASKNLFEEINHDYGVSASYIRLAKLSREKGNLARAEAFLGEAKELVLESGAQQTEYRLYEEMALTYAAGRKFQKAYAAQQKYFERYSEINNKDNTQAITELKKEYEFKREREKAEAAVVLADLKTARTLAELETQNAQNRTLWGGILGAIAFAGVTFFFYLSIRQSKRQINAQNVLLAQSVKEKEMMVREIHHRVKNNLQVMSGLLQLQARDSDNQQLKKALKESQSRIFSISSIHELLYQKMEDQSVEAHEYFEQILLKNLHIANQKYRYSITTNSLRLSMDHAIPLGLMLNEMTSNTLQHGFGPGQAGEISLQLDLDEQGKNYRFVYRDNGRGLASVNDQANGKSLGLSLISLMAKQLGGKLVVDGQQGTTFTLTFP